MTKQKGPRGPLSANTVPGRPIVSVGEAFRRAEGAGHPAEGQNRLPSKPPRASLDRVRRRTPTGTAQGAPDFLNFPTLKAGQRGDQQNNTCSK